MTYYSTRKDYLQVQAEADLTTRGGRLRAAREATGLSVDGLAKLLMREGINENSTATVSRYETNKKVAPLEYVELMALLSGYSLDWLVLGVGDRGSAKDLIRRLRERLDAAEVEYVSVNAEPRPIRPPLEDLRAAKVPERIPNLKPKGRRLRCSECSRWFSCWLVAKA